MDVKCVSGTVVSSKPVSLSTAAKILSDFATMDNGFSPAMSPYLKLAAGSFNDLVMFHKDLKASSRKSRFGASSSSVFKGRVVGRKSDMITPIPYGGGEDGEGGGVMVADAVNMLKKEEIMEGEDSGGKIVRESEGHGKNMKEEEGEEGNAELVFMGSKDTNAVHDSDKKHRKKEKKKRIKEEQGGGRSNAGALDGEVTAGNQRQGNEDWKRIESKEGKKNHENEIKSIKAEAKSEPDVKTEAEVKTAEGMENIEVANHTKREGGEVDLKIKESMGKKHKNKNKHAAIGEGRSGNIEDVKIKISEGVLAIAKEGKEIELESKDSEKKRHKRKNKEDEVVKKADGGTEGAVYHADGKQEVKGSNDELGGGDRDQHVVTMKSENQESRKRKIKEMEAPGLDDSVERQRPHKKKKRKSEASH